MADPPQRYSRQILFAGIGADGQRRLRRASVVVVGCGALGSVLAELLARAGAGRLRLLDRDFVEPSNLQRQLLFSEEDAAAALPKAVAAERRLRAINGDIQVEGVVDDLTPGNAARHLDGFDLLLDGTDNFETRYLLNDFAVREGRPWIYGACVGSYGVTMTVRPGETPCLRCLMPAPPAPGTSPTCDTAGVIGPIVAAIAAIQATEALKVLAGQERSLCRGLTALDLWQGSRQVIDVPRDAACPACGQARFEFLEGGSTAPAARLCGRHAVQVAAAGGKPPDLQEIARRLGAVGEVVENPYLVRARVEGHDLTVFRDGRTIVGGTDDPAVARSVYARLLGA